MNSKFFLFVCLFITFFAFPSNAQKDGKTFKVVIDAGHGGKDPGCLGTYSREKDVALDVALKTGKLISENCPNVKVIYTRSTDVFVELYNRAKIANSHHADLFISFHCNANDNHSAHGVETYVMGLDKSEKNLAVAKKENAAMLMEEGYKDHYAGFNPDSPESAVMFSLYSSAYLNNSILLADKVQKNLVGVTHLLDRGVKQAPYWVLWSVSMPSILIEMGFLSNPTEEKFLTDEQHKKEIADAIYRGFASYYTQMTGDRVSTPEPPKQEPKDNKTETKDDHSADNPSDNQSDKKADDETAKIANTPVNPDAVRFVVQFMAVPDKIALTDKRFKDIPKVNRYYEGGLWKYTAGSESNLQSAKEILSSLKSKYPDAFVIAFKGEQKIPVSEAVKLVK
jgi:N-acetylmuramoyl-L-alanine amidase